MSDGSGGFILFIVTILSGGIVAWLSACMTARTQRKMSFNQEIVKQLDGLVCLSDSVSDLTRLHLSGGHSRPFSIDEASATRNRIMQQIKLMNNKSETLRLYVSKKNMDSLSAGLVKFKQSLTGDRFPVLRDQDKCHPGDKPLADVDTAQTEWEICCHRIRVKFCR
ncbi:MAG: hypothetical protein JW739_08805 [Opitutales bacterium]|nr:hypothetical protein [Opitutales bacterium]